MRQVASRFAIVALLFGVAADVKADVFTGTLYQTTNHDLYGSGTSPDPDPSDVVITAAYKPTIDQASIIDSAIASQVAGSTPNYSKATFTVPTVNFDAPTGSFPYTPTGFVGSSLGAIDILSETAGFDADASLNNTYLVLNGNIFLAQGQTFHLFHNDGAQLIVVDPNGNTATVSDTSPTPLGDIGYTAQTTGIFNITIGYGEIAGPPAILQLEGDLGPLAAVPEPSSIALASLGLATFGLVQLRRRRAKA